MVIQELKRSLRVEGRWLRGIGGRRRPAAKRESRWQTAPCYPGRELTEEEGEALMAAIARSTLREKALNLLARKPQSRRELERKLAEWGSEPQEAEAICDRLETGIPQ